MSRDDFYDSLFGRTYSAYMERPRLNRLIARVAWGGDTRPYCESMGAVAEVPTGGTVVDCPNPRAAIGEAARVLQPGGRLVGCCFVRGDGLRQRLQLRPHATDFGPLCTEPELLEWLADVGFRDVSSRRSGLFMFFDALRDEKAAERL